MHMPHAETASRDRLLYVLVGALLFLSVLLRAWNLPLVHDEARTWLVYVLSGDFLPFRAQWDAGNHVLVTAIAWLAQQLFGEGPIVLRLFPVFSFALYGWYGWRLSGAIRSRPLAWSLRLGWLCSPFVLDFFSLFRGYGPALAFLAMAVHHCIAFVASPRDQRLWPLLLAVSLGTWCSLNGTLLGMVMLTLVLPGIVLQPGRRRVAMAVQWLFLGLAPLIIAVRYGQGLAERGALYYGSGAGWVEGTLASLTLPLLGTHEPIARWLLLVPVLLALLVALYAVVKQGRAALRDPLTVAAVLLAAEVVGRSLMHALWGTLLPIDRTALHLVPPALLVIAFAADRIAAQRPWTSWVGAALLLLPPVLALRAWHPARTVSWPEESAMLAQYRVVAERAAAAEHILSVGAYRQMVPIWDVQARMAGMAVPVLDPHGHPASYHDLLLVDTGYFDVPHGYRVVEGSRAGRQVLFERIVPVALIAFVDTAFTRAASDPEFQDLWNEPAERFTPGLRCVELDLLLHCADEVLSAEVVIEQRGADGQAVQADRVELCARHKRTGTDRIRFRRWIPAADAARSLVVYLYNPRRQIIEQRAMQLRMLRISTDNELRTLEPH
jgi:hypothetical protein